jgi:hypothetical protein
MKTLRGKLEKVSWLATGALIFFDGEVYTVPEGSNARAIGWLVTARQGGCPVTLEVDDKWVIRKATIEVEGHTVEAELPNGTLKISGPAP